MPEESLALEKSPPSESMTALSDSPYYARGVYPGLADETLDFHELWRKLRRHLWIVVTLVVVVTTLGTVVMLKTKSTYQATTTLEIGKETGTVVRSADAIIPHSDLDEVQMTSIKTKMVSLKSRELLEDVVVDLRLDENPEFHDPRRTGWLSSLVSRPPVRLQGEEVWRNNLAKNLPRSPAESRRLAPFVRELEKGLEVEQIKETRALQVSYTHTNPVIAAVVANSVAEHFIRRTFEGKTERFTHTAAWLDRSTRELKAKVEQAEQSLANYTRENNIFSTEGQATLTTDKLARLHEQVTRAETDRILKETLYEEVRQGRVAQVPEAFAEIASKSQPKIVALQKEYDQLKNMEAELNVNFGPENPKLQEVQQRMASVQQQIEASRHALEAKLKVEYEHAVRDEQALRAALAQAKAAAVAENQAGISYSILKQDVETSRALYTEFLHKANQSRISVAEQYSNIRIVDHAKEPTEPNGPKRLLVIVTCFFLSLAGGLGLAFAREFLDNKIKGVDDVSRFTQLPTLSAIPVFSPEQLCRRRKSLKPGAQSEGGAGKGLQSWRETWRGWLNNPGESPLPTQSWAFAAEAYNTLRTSILHSTPGGAPKTILMTSGEPGDGKTTTAINTAISFAQLGASVLVIDADLRRPSLHKIFGADNGCGLSTYLSGGSPLANLIQPLPIANLYLLPSGPTPPHPANLISSTKMQKLVEIAGQHFDYILIDSPPLLSLSDAVILSTLVDGVILVGQSGQTTRDTLRRSRLKLLSVGANLLGVVLNKVNLRQAEGSSYQYYYG
jgi:polysaccharide biosynthesis transport protein